MSYQSEHLWYLELKVKALENQVNSFRSGNAYVRLRKDYESVIRGKDLSIKRLEKELSEAHSQIINNRNQWFDVSEEMEKEFHKAIKTKDKKIQELGRRVLKAECQRDDALNQMAEWRKKYYELTGRLEELEGLNKKLTAQVNQNFENSSTPSSQQGADRKKAANTREKTGRRPGGQKGHEGHRLTQMRATETHHLPDPEKYASDPCYYATGEKIKRQKIVLRFGIDVVEYTATVFRNRETGSRVHADFPDGFYTDITYDSSVKALAFLLANEGNMSARKIKTVLYEVSGGALNISEATINGLCREFSGKTEQERKAIMKEVLLSPVLNVDFTNANVNGKAKQVFIIASPGAGSCMYIARDKKGHKGIEGTPITEYVGTLVHDHEYPNLNKIQTFPAIACN